MKKKPGNSWRQKSFGFKAAGVEVTPELLAKINGFAMRELTADEVYVRKFLVCHNGIDRDRERFPEALLDDFSKTLPGKSLLMGHSRSGPGIGLFCDSMAEEMTPEQFRALTGEEIRLPDGKTSAKVVWGLAYMLKNDHNDGCIQNIDGGIYRHHSIGFRASDLVAVKGPFEQVLYWEYVPPGEALEGSIVWLGAQPGATAQKGAGDPDMSGPSDDTDGSYYEKEEGGRKMKGLLKILAKLFPGKTFTEEGLPDEVREAFEEYVQKAKKALDDAVAPLKARIAELEPLEAKVKELTPLAEEGKAYRKDLCETYATLKAKVGDIDERPETREKTVSIAGGFGIDFLKEEAKVLQLRVEKMFPSGSQLEGDMRQDKTGDLGGGKKKNALGFDEKR